MRIMVLAVLSGEGQIFIWPAPKLDLVTLRLVTGRLSTTKQPHTMEVLARFERQPSFEIQTLAGTNSGLLSMVT